jgi:hypothetical protein
MLALLKGKQNKQVIHISISDQRQRPDVERIYALRPEGERINRL